MIIQGNMENQRKYIDSGAYWFFVKLGVSSRTAKFDLDPCCPPETVNGEQGSVILNSHAIKSSLLQYIEKHLPLYRKITYLCFGNNLLLYQKYVTSRGNCFGCGLSERDFPETGFGLYP